MSQDDGTNRLDFVYDASGTMIGFKLNGTTNYYYLRNLQGDVIGIYDSDGEIVCRYTYNTWGYMQNILDENGDSNYDPTHIANINPIRYRGYYFDRESDFYYLQSRYYSPEICRFISADALFVAGDPITGANMYAYCGNNPVMHVDPTGYAISDYGPMGQAIVILGLLNYALKAITTKIPSIVANAISITLTSFSEISEGLWSFDFTFKLKEKWYLIEELHLSFFMGTAEAWRNVLVDLVNRDSILSIFGSAIIGGALGKLAEWLTASREPYSFILGALFASVQGGIDTVIQFISDFATKSLGIIEGALAYDPNAIFGYMFGSTIRMLFGNISKYSWFDSTIWPIIL